MNSGLQILSPASCLHASNWLFQENRDIKWTHEENKCFENALALYDKDTPDRWFKVAAMIPGKTVADVIKQYRELEEDVSDIEAGLIPIPEYISGSFSLDYTPGGKKGTATRPFDQERKKGVPWTEEEHRQFLMGLKKYGRGDWRSISLNFVTSRTPTQVASHAQKYFIRRLTGGKEKRRSSIHDITTVNIPGDTPSTPLDHCKPSSPDNSSAVARVTTTELFDFEWNRQNGAAAIVFSPSCRFPPYGTKQEEHNLRSGAPIGSQFESLDTL
ncbi:Transcription factor DIVARICATA [Hibiscus syriacus]|uniref:Transcription factor DIVARICATA n=1 Tax=Hibiscus syriacus TaxID=106335 RepID=A0A6A2WX01_HIBSY|nr:transcription factor DIVARICATA-like [Hibiscus syriacus]KAE8654266.1 Transcription factor DIVARICATA [Hibiscus syriacus]